MSLPIYVVSLKESSKRREGISHQLRALDLPFQFIDAIRGSSLSKQARENDVANIESIIAHRGKPLSDSEIGCALSHVTAYRLIIESNIPYAVILEDDALLLPGFKEAIAAASSAAPDMLVLGYPKLSPFEIRWAPLLDPIKRLGRLPSNHIFGLTTRSGQLGTVGYVISRAAAEQMVRMNYPVRTVADDHPYFSKQIRIWHVRPLTICEDMQHVSTIQGKHRGNHHGLSARQVLGRLIKALTRQIKCQLMRSS